MMMMRLCWDFYILSYIVYRVGRLLRFLYDGPAAAETFHRAAARPLLRPWIEPPGLVCCTSKILDPLLLLYEAAARQGRLSKLPPPTIWRANEWGPAASGAKRKEKRVMFTIPADSIQNIRSWARKRRTLSVSLLMRYRREPADDGPYTDDWNPLPVEFLRRFRHSGNKKRTGAGDSFKRNAGQKNLSTGWHGDGCFSLSIHSIHSLM